MYITLFIKEIMTNPTQNMKMHLHQHKLNLLNLSTRVPSWTNVSLKKFPKGKKKCRPKKSKVAMSTNEKIKYKFQL